MSRPPKVARAVSHTKSVWPLSSKRLLKIASVGLIFASLGALIACQGVSAGANQQQLGNLSLAGNSLQFGNVASGSSKSLSLSATNTGNASLTISSAAVSSKYYSVTAPSFPATLASGQGTTLTVVFQPTEVASFNANLTLTTSASSTPATVSLSGNGTSAASPGQLTSAPTSESFGNVQVGSKQAQNFTITNTGGTAVNISQAAVSGTGFQVSGISVPLTLNPSQTTSMTVTFAPQTSGAVTGSLTITSDASNSSLAVPLSGTGVTPGTLGPSSASLSFGSDTVGHTESLSETLTNTGGSSVTISQAAISGTGFAVSGITTPFTLSVGQSTTISVSFDPSAAGNASGTLTLTSDGSNPSLAIPLTGTGVTAGALTPSPASIAFGNETVGQTQTIPETVTNTGGSSISISQVAVTGTGFSFSGITTPVTLTAGQSATFSVSFDPSSAGSATGTVTVTSTASNPSLAIPLSGAGVTAGTLTPNPSSLSFGTQTVGQTATLSETVTNTGGTSVSISKVAVTGTGFSFSGVTTPVTLTAGQSTTFSVSFDPSSAGSASGTLAITSNASNPTLNVALSGTGVTPGTLSPSPSSLSFGNQTVGQTATLSETITNTGGTSVSISKVAVTGTGFGFSGITTPVTLTAGQSTTFSVSFDPASAGSASGTLTVTSNASNPTLNVALSGTGVTVGTLSPNPSSLSFGSETVGQTATLSETLTNTGGTSVSISKVAVTGSGFSFSGITTPITVPAGQSASFSVSFDPSSTGSASGTLTITSNGSNPTLNIALSGTGVAAAGTLTATPATIAIGNVQVGSSGTGTGTLTASGANVTVSAATSNNSVFTISGLSLPVTITAGQSVPFTVSFDPTATGAASATLTFTSNANPTTTTEAVTGTGTAASTHSVSLSWTASTSANISGYNIYRAVYTTSCGTFAQVNSTLNTSTTYTDSTVINGTNYCYAATAVNSSNEESGYSNIVSDVQIP